MASDKYTVIGPRLIAGVAKGGSVELDPAAYNIAALIAAGHIKPKGKPAVPPATEEAQP